ncbi:MAG: 30S ribosomal protein S4e [Halodesulfurarchaeum sp.]
MSNHQKRLSVPKSWPVERKTDTFTAKAGAGPHGESGVPLVVVLRDVLGYVDTAKEASYAVNTGGVLVNGRAVDDINRPIGMFDILAFPDREEYYRVFPDQGGRLGLTPIDEEAAGSKLGKIIDKTPVSGDRTQLNLHDGGNIIVEEDVYSGNDSVVIDNESNEVVAHFPYEEGALVTAVAGQHAGEVGEIAQIDVTPGSAENTVRVDTGEGSFETIEEYVVVIDENFVEDEPDEEPPTGPVGDESTSEAETATEAAESETDAEVEGESGDEEPVGADEDETPEEDVEESEKADGGTSPETDGEGDA